MILFNSATLGDGCGVYWVMSSSCEFGVNFDWFSSVLYSSIPLSISLCCFLYSLQIIA